MMIKTKALFKLAIPRILVTLLISCFLASCAQIQDRPLPFPSGPSTKTLSERSLVIEDEGKILVDFGRDCGRSDRPGEEEVVKIEGEREFPDFVDDATVFLNGWQFTYLGDDHNVSALLTFITDIRLEDNRLTWEVLGAIEEDDFDSAYEFCYTYTVIGWNKRNIDIVSYNEEQPSVFEGFSHPVTNWTAEGGLSGLPTIRFNTALVPLSSYITDSEFAAKGNAAVLPRGFNIW